MSETLKVGDKAPLFKVKNQDGEDFDLSTRKGTWTILYFYPKAETPGCTKQACSFRDRISMIREKGGDVFGISTDSVTDIKKFHTNHKLNFSLLSDNHGDVTKSYGAKLPLLKMAKRWTFIIDPDLIIKNIDNNVDPVMDPEHAVKVLDGK